MSGESLDECWIDCGKYWEFKPSQGTDEWLKGRIGRVTTAVSGVMGGKSTKFKTVEEQGKIIAGIMKEDFTPEALDRMNHGTETESVARDWAIKFLSKPIRERGLIVPKWDPFIGASIDGDIEGTPGIIEIKAPREMYYPLRQYIDQKAAGWNPPVNYHNHIWPTHYAQMQHALAVTGKEWCLYVVYCTTDNTVFTQKVSFDPVYWKEHYQTLKQNYTKYVQPHLSPNYPLMPPQSSVN